MGNSPRSGVPQEGVAEEGEGAEGGFSPMLVVVSPAPPPPELPALEESVAPLDDPQDAQEPELPAQDDEEYDEISDNPNDEEEYEDNYPAFEIEEQITENPNPLAKLYKVTTIAGNGSTRTTEDVGTKAGINWPYDVRYTRSGEAFFTAYGSASLRKIGLDGRVVTVLDRPDAGETFSCPRGIAVDRQDNVYICDSAHDIIRKVTPDLHCVTLPITPPLSSPYAIAVDSKGTLIVADTYNNSLRKVFPDGTSQVFVGNGRGNADGPPGQAQLNHPQGMALDEKDVIYLADTGNNCIRRITPEGEVSTLQFAEARPFLQPYSVAMDRQGNVIVADYGTSRIRKINLKTMTVMTIAGAGHCEFDPPFPSKFSMPTGLTVDKNNHIIVCDCYNHIIRKVQFVMDELALGWPKSHTDLPQICQEAVQEMTLILRISPPVQGMPKELLLIINSYIIATWPFD